MLYLMLWIGGVAIISALIFALYNYEKVKRLPAGTPAMQEIANAIQEGAAAFIAREYKIVLAITVGVSVLFGLLFDPLCGAALFVGVAMSAIAGYIGMKIAVIANVRVTNEAKTSIEEKKPSALGRTLKIAFQGGSVMGLSVQGFALLGLLVVWVIVGQIIGYSDPSRLEETVGGIFKLTYMPFVQVLACYSLGCSVVALFNRLGGGIFTKGADMGADLVGKSELKLPEDDVRNPASIADNVGDNVGDVAGMGSDLLESFVGAIVSAVVLPASIFLALENTVKANFPISKIMQFPVTFAALGLIACVIGIAFVLIKRASKNPRLTLNISLWTSAALIGGGGAVLSWLFFRDFTAEQFEIMGFRLGFLSPWVSGLTGIVAGILMGIIAERYTSDAYKETKNIAALAKRGTALLITGGLSSGWRSCLPGNIVLAGGIIVASLISGPYGAAMAAVGMLAFVAATVTVDSYGPIADNAGGIAEIGKLDPKVRKITDTLDSIGNTTAAVGKGFAIGSGVLAALALMISFAHAVEPQAVEASLNIINFLALGGAFVGVGLMHWLSGNILQSVTRSAERMVEEVRYQFKNIAGLLEGKEGARPDYRRCIDISTKCAIKEMGLPVAVALAAPIVGGLLFGPLFVGGLLVGCILDASTMATSTANSGGTWDNAKKLIESQGLKGTEIHEAAVNGDTVGDGLKDVVGPNQDILIKLMSTVSLASFPLFLNFNIINLIFK